MAEAVASGFGITTFGFQIGMRLYELRGLYKEFSAVPADVDALLVECARFARIIADVESQPNLVTSCRTSSTVFDECRTSCKAVLGVLDGIAQDLKSRTSKSKVKGSIKALLRKDELSKLKEQLRTTKEDFLIAWQIVNSAMLYQLTITQVSLPTMIHSPSQQIQLQQLQQTQPLNLPQVAEPTSLVPVSCTSPISISYPPGRGLTPSQDDLRKLRQLRFQSRWIGKAWHIQSIVALGDWTFHFRTWNLLKSIYDTPVVTCIQNDDLLGFKKLMASGRYTMCDREQHWTMFQHAIGHGSLNIMEYYLSRNEQTFEQCISDAFVDSAGLFKYYRFIDIVRGLVDSHESERCLRLVKTLVQKILSGGFVDGCAPAMNEVSPLAEYTTRYSTSVPEGEIGSGKNLARQLSDGLVLHQPGISFNRRMQYAIQFAEVEDAWLFWHFLGKAQLDQACVEAEILNTSGNTLLTRCAESLYEHGCEVNGKRLGQREARNLQHKCECSLDKDYIKLVRQALELGDLERSFSRGKSLLRLVVKSAAGKRGIRADTVDAVLDVVNVHVRMWLRILYCAGMNLDQYGQQEYEFLKVNADKDFAVKSERTGAQHHARLTNFRWGKTLDDWKFWWSTSMDEINNTFLLHHVVSWDSTSNIGRSKFHVPGAWVEEQQPNSVDDDEIKRRARSRRRRKRYLTAAGRSMRDAREVFGRCDFHGWEYQPKLPRKDCLAHCYKFSRCRLWPEPAG